MADIEIRYLKDDGRLSVVFRPNCISNIEARQQAYLNAGERVRSAEIWNGLERVEQIALPPWQPLRWTPKLRLGGRI